MGAKTITLYSADIAHQCFTYEVYPSTISIFLCILGASIGTANRRKSGNSLLDSVLAVIGSCGAFRFIPMALEAPDPKVLAVCGDSHPFL